MRTGGKRRVLINTRGKIIRKYFERTKKQGTFGTFSRWTWKSLPIVNGSGKTYSLCQYSAIFSPNRKHSYILIDSYTYGVMWD